MKSLSTFTSILCAANWQKLKFYTEVMIILSRFKLFIFLKRIEFRKSIWIQRNKNCQFATNYDNVNYDDSDDDATDKVNKTILKDYIINLHILFIYVLDRKR